MRATAHFVQPIRVVARWQPSEIEIVRDAVARGLDLAQTHALLSYRSWHSVKDIYYRERPRCHEEPVALTDARRQKDAREGSERLLNALRAAGFAAIKSTAA